MARVVTDFRGRIANVLVEAVSDCTHIEAGASRLLQSPEKVSLDVLREDRLEFVPFPESQALVYAEQLFARWSTRFRSGVYVLESDCEATPSETRAISFNTCARLKFDDASCLTNSLMVGRFFLWIDRPSVFMVFSFSDFSGIGWPVGTASALLGRSLRDFIPDLVGYAEACRNEHQRNFYHDLASHYSNQWSLAASSPPQLPR